MVLLDPAAVENLAAAADAAARQLADIGDGLEQRAATAVWQGGTADAFRSTMAQRRAQCHGDADELQQIAAQLRAAAANFRAELASLNRLENRIRDWFTANAATAAHVAGLALTAGGFPPPGSPAWNDVARKLAAQGVRF